MAKNELQTFSLNPTTFEEAVKFADLMAKSEMVPKVYKDKPGNVLVAVQMGAELGMPAMQSIQNIAVINGKPGIYGDLGKALLLADGCDIDEDDTEVIKKNQKARCKITRKGRTPVERTFSVDDAKTAGLWNKEGPWKTYPWRQMAWRAFWFAARDAASDVLKGMGGAEELIDKPIDMGDAVVIDNETGQTVGAAGLSEKLKNKPAPKQEQAKPTAQAETIVETEKDKPLTEDAQQFVNDMENAEKADEATGAAQTETKRAANPINPNKIKVIQATLKKSNMTEQQLFEKMGISGFDEIDDSDINKALTAASGK
jgi:hypothetical protein